MIVLRAIGLAMLAGTIIVAAFHAVIGDMLLFKSDPASLARYFACAATIVGLGPLLLLGVPALLVRRWRSTLRLVAVVALSVALAGGFVASIAWVAAEWFHLGLLLGRVVDMGDVHRLKVWIVAILPLAGIGGGILILAVVVRAVRRDPEMVRRIEHLGMATLALLVLAAAMSFVPIPNGMPQDKNEAKRNAVMIVVDRFPAWALHVYNPKAPASGFDDLAARAAVYTSVYSSRPYTNGYFGALYAGRLPGEPPRGNLVGNLQDAGIVVRLINSHRSALPESADTHVSAYRGLRSRLLGPSSIQVPIWLGLDYHYTIATPGAYEGRFLPGLWSFLNQRQRKSDPLNGELTNELERLAQSQRGPSFTLFHVNLSDFSKGKETGSPQFLSDDGETLSSRIMTNEYRYDPSPAFQELASYNRQLVYSQVSDLSHAVSAFLANLNRIPGFGDAVVIVTADHGTIYDRGRFWYGYHPNKEVLNVPFLMFGADEPGIDDRVCSTPDIAQTLIAHFGIPQPRLTENGRSMLGNGLQSEVPALTMRSDKHAEWWLVLNRLHSAVHYNLHPDAAERISSVQYDGYSDTPQRLSVGERTRIVQRVRAAAARFGLTDAEMQAAELN